MIKKQNSEGKLKILLNTAGSQVSVNSCKVIYHFKEAFKKFLNGNEKIFIIIYFLSNIGFAQDFSAQLLNKLFCPQTYKYWLVSWTDL